MDSTDTPEQRDGATANPADRRVLAAIPPANGAPQADGVPPALLPEDIASARRYAAASRAASTRRKYQAAWEAFCRWCAAHEHPAIPAHPGVVAVYLSREAERGLSPSAITVALAAIAWAHKRGGCQPPQRGEGGVVIGDVLSGIRREHGRPPARKAAADGDILRTVLQAITGDGLRDVRDRALLAFGMAAALRRSELVALLVDDIVPAPEGLRVTIRSSKTDQEGRGAVVAVPDGRRLKPVARLQAWTTRAGITKGYLFRRISNAGDQVLDEPMTGQSVARVVQRRVAEAGLNPKDYSGHSLRAGFLTSAARAGASVFKMREVSRHKTVQVLADYVRDARIFEDHAGEAFL